MIQIKFVVAIGIIGLAMQTSYSASIPAAICSCTREYFPICASNNITYSNKCLFECEKKQHNELEIKFFGACEEEFRVLKTIKLPTVCLCKTDYLPICGSDGKTYSNECELKCAQRKNDGLQIKHIGECVDEIQVLTQVVQDDRIFSKCACTFEYMPLCASNQRTYANLCELNCEIKTTKTPLRILHSGLCADESEIMAFPMVESASCICTLIYMPICGTNGKTYSNDCELNCAKTRDNSLGVKHQGECVQHVEPDYCVCTMEYMPLCGSDGITYGNLCGLTCANKNKGIDIRVKHIGECE